MKDKPNEWISIADLMAGVVAVVMLLFIVAVVRIQQARPNLEALGSCKKFVTKIDAREEVQKRIIREKLQELKSTMKKSDEGKLIDVDIVSGKITLKEHTFRSGSACIDEQGQAALKVVARNTSQLLRNASIEGLELFVEGHTDDKHAGNSADLRLNCAFYNDNNTLSAARANETKKILVEDLPEKLQSKVIVVGYGDTQPLPNHSPGDANNRRVELRFLVRQNLVKSGMSGEELEAAKKACLGSN